MKKRFVFVALIALLIASASQAANINKDSNLVDEGVEPAPAPQTILGDIPLMRELQILREPKFWDILPGGNGGNRIITVGIVDTDDVYNYYQKALPALGWKSLGAHDYMRDGKILHIDMTADGKRSTVTFSKEKAPAN